MLSHESKFITATAVLSYSQTLDTKVSVICSSDNAPFERSEFFSADTVLLALQFLYALLQSALLRIERGNFRLYVIKIKAFSDR